MRNLQKFFRFLIGTYIPVKLFNEQFLLQVSLICRYFFKVNIAGTLSKQTQIEEQRRINPLRTTRQLQVVRLVFRSIFINFNYDLNNLFSRRFRIAFKTKLFDIPPFKIFLSLLFMFFPFYLVCINYWCYSCLSVRFKVFSVKTFHI